MSSFKRFQKVFSFIILLVFSFGTILPSPAFAQNVFAPALPPVMLSLSPAFTPPMIQGLVLHPENPLEFDFLVNEGDSNIKGETFKEEADKLIRYFLASLTIPEKDLWVNLAPGEQNRIIPDDLSVTQMGRDLLAQDYLLKKLMSSLIYPESETGKKFWDKIYKRTKAEFGISEIPTDTLNRVWIVPNKVVVYVNEGAAFVAESSLKVMLEEEYLEDVIASSAKQSAAISEKDEIASSSSTPRNDATNIIKSIVIPELEKEVNSGTHFAPLRQIYNSLILADWFKKNLQNSLVGQLYADKRKVVGVDDVDKNTKLDIYNKYLKTYKQGAYNYIKEEYDPSSQEIIPKKYFSGGFGAFMKNAEVVSDSAMLSDSGKKKIAGFGLLKRIKTILGMPSKKEKKATIEGSEELGQDVQQNDDEFKEGVPSITFNMSVVDQMAGFDVVIRAFENAVSGHLTVDKFVGLDSNGEEVSLNYSKRGLTSRRLVEELKFYVYGEGLEYDSYVILSKKGKSSWEVGETNAFPHKIEFSSKTSRSGSRAYDDDYYDYNRSYSDGSKNWNKTDVKSEENKKIISKIREQIDQNNIGPRMNVGLKTKLRASKYDYRGGGLRGRREQVVNYIKDNSGVDSFVIQTKNKEIIAANDVFGLDLSTDCAVHSFTFKGVSNRKVKVFVLYDTGDQEADESLARKRAIRQKAADHLLVLEKIANKIVNRFDFVQDIENDPAVSYYKQYNHKDYNEALEVLKQAMQDKSIALVRVYTAKTTEGNWGEINITEVVKALQGYSKKFSLHKILYENEGEKAINFIITSDDDELYNRIARNKYAKDKAMLATPSTLEKKVKFEDFKGTELDKTKIIEALKGLNTFELNEITFEGNPVDLSDITPKGRINIVNNADKLVKISGYFFTSRAGITVVKNVIVDIKEVSRQPPVNGKSPTRISVENTPIDNAMVAGSKEYMQTKKKIDVFINEALNLFTNYKHDLNMTLEQAIKELLDDNNVVLYEMIREIMQNTPAVPRLSQSDLHNLYIKILDAYQGANSYTERTILY
ncbi:MAG: hypothetical protein P9X22_08600 [Candidatus Zapsychrus exili]|nr:hypothetical protein [Candidatus Zapsychrus exili]